MRKLFEAVTQQIIEAIEAGAAAYQMPWHNLGAATSPLNAISRRRYRGINTLILAAAAGEAGFASGEWATFAQWRDAGASVRKGERGRLALLWKPVAAKSEDGADAHERFICRAFRVFNLAQVDGYEPPLRPVLDEAHRIEAADAFVQGLDAILWFGGDRAFYDPQADLISLPSFAQFKSPRAYYATLNHELVHWSGHKSRLSRNLAGRFGSAAYAVEELVAELGASFLCAHLGLEGEPRRDHAPYLASWLEVLRGDPRAIIAAASQAQAAADFLIDRSQTSRTDASSIAKGSDHAAEIAA